MDLSKNASIVSSSSFHLYPSYSQKSASTQLGNCKTQVANGGSIKHDNCSISEDGSAKKGYPMENGTCTLEDFKKKVTTIVEEYFLNNDIAITSIEVTHLHMPSYHHYFVKKLVSIAMDRHDHEKEMASVLLSSLYAKVIDPQQVYQGFCNLVESADDLIVDIPDVVEILAVFLARAVVDDILPLAFLSKQLDCLPEDLKGREILRRAKKGYLLNPYHEDILERKWGSAKRKTVENTRERIRNLLTEYAVSGDKKEASKCIKDLHVPFFHHEIVKQAIVIAMEKQKSEERILDLLKTVEEEGLINTSQMSKGFGRLIDSIDDISLDIPNAREILESLISKAASQGWLHASSLKSIPRKELIKKTRQPSIDTGAKSLKKKAQRIVEEYFLLGDVSEVFNNLEVPSSFEFNSVFVKQLINLAMDRKKREKEMASILLSSLCLPADDVINGFEMLIESADDIALDNPIVDKDLAMFLARAIVDEVLAPSHLDIIEKYCSLGGSISSLGNQVIPRTRSLLNAHLAAERILRCWGGEGNGSIGWVIEDLKDKMGKLLEEYESGGGFKEAYCCVKELGVPFFHHEIVKKVLVAEIEKNNERLWRFLDECFTSGLITMNQMTKGFERVDESLDDLVLDVPDARAKFMDYVDKAMVAGWLDPSFSTPKRGQINENGF